MKVIDFFVPGLPATAGSKRAIPIYKGKGVDREFTGHSAVVDSCKKKTTWMADVKHFAYQQYDEAPLLGPLRLDVTFHMPRPLAHYRTGKYAGVLKPSAPKYHTKIPDRGKLLRAIEDAITGVIWKDDAQVCDGNVSKLYSNDKPGAYITITVI